MNNYTITHLHSDLSNGTTNIDSITKFDKYIDRAKELNMHAIAFTEHGNIFQWKKKKEYCEKNGLKYIHGIECYITASLTEKTRDNYHTCLYASNFDGFKEINKLISKANNRSNCLVVGEGEQYYYVPRITMDDFLNISDNIIITSACLGGVLHKCTDETIKQRYLDYFIKHKDRCFLEIQHHLVKDQIDYNKYLYKLHNEYDIPLIIATDTHALNKEHLKGRSILQKSKGIFFDNEDGWDLSLKTYDELIELYKKQNSVPMNDVYIALENTNKLADMVEEYTIDKSYKYPKLYNNSEQVFKKKIRQGVKDRKIDKKDNYKEYKERINYEYKTIKANGSIDFFLLEEDLKSMCRKNGIKYGYSRGSVSGSEIAYALYITEIDSIKHRMNFERFMNLERVSLADVDTDYAPKDREKIKDYLFNKKGLYCSEIITFNTIALKGAIRDVGRALEIPLSEIGEMCGNIEENEQSYRSNKKYKELFEYVDILQGVIVSVGTHPCGFIVSPIPLDENVGLFTTSTSKYPISQLNMKEVDFLNFVKLDILGLDNIQVINEVCELANIERLTPDNINEYDEKVWDSILEDNLGIFQWESSFAHEYYKKLFSKETIAKIKAKNPNFKYMDLFSIGNGAIRPAGASYRNELANGIYKDNGNKALNDFLAPTLGYLTFQESIIEFLHSFCGYTMGEADIVRRGFAKKTGTEQYIPKIKEGFYKTMAEKYNTPQEESEKIIVSFIQVIIDASFYLFSENHAKPYSYIGYACAWLRYYYPIEFLTVCSNIWSDNKEKTDKIINYANKININIISPKFRYSKGGYFYNKEANSIYKGIGSIKFLNSSVADDLYNLKDNVYNDFYELLKDIKSKTSCNSRQLDILIKCGYFSEFGGINKILNFINYVNILYLKKSPKKKTISEKILVKNIIKIIENNSTPTEATYTKFDYENSLQCIWNSLDNEDAKIQEKIVYQKEILGYTDYKDDKLDKRYVLVSDINTKYTPVMNTYCLNNGNTCKVKISKKIWNNEPLQENQIIYIHAMERKFGFKKIGEKTDKKGKVKPLFEVDESKLEWHILEYDSVENLEGVQSSVNKAI
jgi:DNA polymerase-3 subunit alpha